MNPDVPSSDSSPNGRYPQSPWTQLRVDLPSAGYCRVTFHHPPVNSHTATTVAELAELLELIETDPDLNVVVFDSADPDHFLAQDDGPAGMRAWPDVLARLSRVPVVSIASIRGRVGGPATEFVLACDLRFAARESTVLGSLTVGAPAVSAGGAIARLARLVGRGRALEILLLAGDLDGADAERCGYLDRLVPDACLDEEVAEVAARIASVDHEVLRWVKACIDRG